MTRAAAAFMGLCVYLGSSVASVQVSNLDQSTLIDALTEEGMSELLLHLIETEPPDDPTVKALLEVAQYKLQFTDPALDRAAQLAALDNAIARQQQLIEEFPDHIQRPIWQVDLAEMLLTSYLVGAHQNAGLFTEFGVPTNAQREAFGKAAVAALEATASADLRFFQLQGTLPREPDHVEKRVNTGLWARMIDDYWRQRLPFYKALASHYVSLLPTAHPYYTQPNENIPDKLPDPTRERARLIDQAQQALEPFVSDTSDAAGVRLAALAIQGRSLLAAGQPDAAAEKLEQVVRANAEDLYGFSARLGLAWAAALGKRFPDALDRVADAAEHPLVREAVLYRVLIADLEHRILLAQAETLPENRRPAAVAAAYEPYTTLLDDPSLGEQAAGLRNYVYSRWAESVEPGEDTSQLPAAVRVAIGEIARIRGQNAMVEAQQSGDEALREQALEHLRQAVAMTEPLAGDADAPDRVRAGAMFNLGLAQYFTDPQSLQQILVGGSTLVRFAEAFPAEPRAEEAIAYAMQMLRAVHALEPQPPGVDEAYREAARVLFSNFALTPAADDERLYYGYFVLERSGQYEEAVEILTGTPPSHPTYFEAQREALFALEQIMNRAPENERERARQALRDRADEVEISVRQAEQPDAPAARSALGAVRLVRAAAAMNEGKVDEALSALDGFEAAFADHPELVRLALERRIVALGQAGRMDDLTQAARAMMERFPDDAAAVIDQVLSRLDTQIESARADAASTESRIRREELQDRATRLASTASLLAELLVDWARGQGFTAEEMLPFELVQAKSLVLAGRADDALAITSRLIEAFPQDASVIGRHADALFGKGDQESLTRASRYYDQLIRGLPGPPYDDAWWNAWLKRLQINDRLGQATADIPLRVRQLRQTDPNLGGERFKAPLERLAEKYQ